MCLNHPYQKLSTETNDILHSKGINYFDSYYFQQHFFAITETKFIYDPQSLFLFATNDNINSKYIISL